MAKFRLSYLHQPSGQRASFYPMDRPDVLEIARQLEADGEEDIRIEDDEGMTWTISAFASLRS